MKAVVQDSYGPPECLQVKEVPRPSLKSPGVLIRVRFASVNALDYRVMRGRPLIGRLMGIGLLRPKLGVRGVDVAGRVEAVSSPDSRFHVGDEVFGLANGTFAEFATAEDEELDLKGSSIPDSDAAALGAAGVAALQAVRDAGRVGPGQRVLITGAASGVGTFAVQIAKHLGAHVTATTSTPNVDLVRSLGADVVLDHTKTDLSRSTDSFDTVVDISGAGSLRAWRRVIRPGGTFVLVGLRKGIGRFIAAGLLRRLFGYPFRVFIAKPRARDLHDLREMVERGTLRAVIDRVYPLGAVPTAMSYAENHRARGKILISVA